MKVFLSQMKNMPNHEDLLPVTLFGNMSGQHTVENLSLNWPVQAWTSGYESKDDDDGDETSVVAVAVTATSAMVVVLMVMWPHRFNTPENYRSTTLLSPWSEVSWIKAKLCV